MPDPARSRAVLIGAYSGFKDLGLGDLPAVERNVKELRQILTDGRTGILPSKNCITILQPRSEKKVLEQVEAAAVAATDMLIVYYSGHGLLVGQKEELYLALRDSKWPDTCLRYDLLRDRLQTLGRRTRRTVVILDCCYSGRALHGEMGERPAISPEEIEKTIDAKARIEGVCVLTASEATRTMRVRMGETFTPFTGTLIDVLRNGIPEGPEFLDMTTLYEEVRLRLSERGETFEPQFGTRAQGGLIVLTRNRAFRRPDPPRSPPPPPPIESTPAGSSGRRSRRGFWNPSALVTAVSLGLIGYAVSPATAHRWLVCALAFSTAYAIHALIAMFVSDDHPA